MKKVISNNRMSYYFLGFDYSCESRGKDWAGNIINLLCIESRERHSMYPICYSLGVSEDPGIFYRFLDYIKKLYPRKLKRIPRITEIMEHWKTYLKAN
jgi:hypothetical protein